MLRLLIFLSVFYGAYTASADVVADQMQLNVEQGICQQEWVDADLAQAFTIENSEQTILALPCSMWAHNFAWSMFLKTDLGNGNELIKPLLFIRHSSYKGIYADSVVENISWDAEEETLTSRKYLNGNSHCGELAGYKWNINTQNFDVVAIFKNDDCTVADKEWERVL